MSAVTPSLAASLPPSANSIGRAGVTDCSGRNSSDNGRPSVGDELGAFLARLADGTVSQCARDTQLVEVALRLLHALPVARRAVLEYLDSVFVTAAEAFFNRLEQQQHHQQQQQTGVNSCDTPVETQLVAAVQQALAQLISTAPRLWAPTLTPWSLTLLGRLSSRFAGRSRSAHASSSSSASSTADLGGALHLWTTCPATDQLLQLVHTCVAADADSCVRPLLDTSLRYSPHFDWVVAHVGSCFPGTIISRMLLLGVSEFAATTTQSASPAEELSEKLKSLIQIVDHLAVRHPKEIDQALVSTLQESFASVSAAGGAAGGVSGSSSAVPAAPPAASGAAVAVVPFLLHVCHLSLAVLNSCTCQALTIVEDRQFEILAAHVSAWVPRFFATTASLLSFVARSVLRCNAKGGLYVIQLLFRLSAADAPFSLRVRHASACVLERILCELEQIPAVSRSGTWRRGGDSGDRWLRSAGAKSGGPDVPLVGALCDLIADSETSEPAPWWRRLLSGACDGASGERWTRLVTAVAACTGPLTAVLSLSQQLQQYLLPSGSPAEPNWPGSLQLRQLLQSLSALELVTTDVLSAAFSHALAGTSSGCSDDIAEGANSCERLNVLRAGLALVCWEQSQRPRNSTRSTAVDSAASHHVKLEPGEVEPEEDDRGAQGSSTTDSPNPQSLLSDVLVSDRRLLSQLCSQLLDPPTADTAAQLLWQLQLPEALSASCYVWLSNCCVDYFFHCVLRHLSSAVSTANTPTADSGAKSIGVPSDAPMLGDTELEGPAAAAACADTLAAVHRAQQLLARLCSHGVCQPLVVRQLVQTALQRSSHGFDGNADQKPAADMAAGQGQDRSECATSLLKANRQATVGTLCVSLAHTSVLRTGVIGSGRRLAPLPAVMTPAPECGAAAQQHPVQLYCRLVVDTLSECVEAGSSAEEICRMVALLLVELISPDIMFNGLPWPDEEFTKVTIERDLQIRRAFDNSELLWQLLELLSRRPPALCYCSVLLRAVAATLINFWSHTQEEKASSCCLALRVTTRLLHIMCVGRLLPPHFQLLPDIIPSVSCYEVMLLFNDVWSYMRETVPSPAAFTTTAGGGGGGGGGQSPPPPVVVWRHFGSSQRRVSRNLVLIVQNNIARLGHLWPQIHATLSDQH